MNSHVSGRGTLDSDRSQGREVDHVVGVDDGAT